MIARIAAILLLACLARVPLAEAHTKSETYTVWHISGPSVRSTFSIPLVEADRLAKNGPRASNDEVSNYLASHVSVTSQEGNCAINGPVRAR